MAGFPPRFNFGDVNREVGDLMLNTGAPRCFVVARNQAGCAVRTGRFLRAKVVLLFISSLSAFKARHTIPHTLSIPKDISPSAACSETQSYFTSPLRPSPTPPQALQSSAYPRPSYLPAPQQSASTSNPVAVSGHRQSEAPMDYSGPHLSCSPPNKAPSLHDSARGSPPPDDQASDRFQLLVDDINKILGPSSGIDSADVDVEELKSAMQDYVSCEDEWQQYAFQDLSRAYTRNLVDAGNGKSNLVSTSTFFVIHIDRTLTSTAQLILVWTPGKGSPIHDHANAHCIMKVLKGSLCETLYCWPCQSGETATDCATSPTSVYPSTQHTCSLLGDQRPSAPRVKRSTIYDADEVTYMSDQLGLHRVENPSKDEVAVSLHLYTVSLA